MVETATEEKVPLEAKNKPFMVCGFLGVFWNLSYGSEDHLGSTRMVLAENGEVKEALMYQPYGTVSDVQGISGSRTDPLRQKFTTKEFDEEGDENGAPGIGLFYFGARYLDPDLGIWTSRDPKEQFFNSYRYTTNPVGFIDPFGLADIEAYIKLDNLFQRIFFSVLIRRELRKLEKLGYSTHLNRNATLKDIDDVWNNRIEGGVKGIIGVSHGGYDHLLPMQSHDLSGNPDDFVHGWSNLSITTKNPDLLFAVNLACNLFPEKNVSSYTNALGIPLSKFIYLPSSLYEPEFGYGLENRALIPMFGPANSVESFFRSGELSNQINQRVK